MYLWVFIFLFVPFALVRTGIETFDSQLGALVDALLSGGLMLFAFAKWHQASRKIRIFVRCGDEEVHLRTLPASELKGGGLMSRLSQEASGRDRLPGGIINRKLDEEISACETPEDLYIELEEAVFKRFL